jgi:hypothetical protein
VPVSVLRPAEAPAVRLPRRGIGRAIWARLGWWLLPPAVLAVLGGLLVAQRHSLWYDELYTAEMVRVPLGDLARAVVSGEGTLSYLRDGPPSYNAPYYAVAKLWLAVTGLAADGVGLRLLSLVASVAAVALFVRAVGHLAGRPVAATAGLVVAMNPLVVEYSAEARGYGLALLGTAAAGLALARWFDGSRRAAVGFGVAAAVAGLGHWFALLAVGGLVLAALIRRRRAAGPIVLAALIGSLPVALLVATAMVNGVGTSGVEWITSSGGQVPRRLLQSWSARHWALWLATVLTLVLALFPPWRRRRATIVAACWFLVPLAVVQAAEAVRPVYVDRYLLPATLGLAALMALGAHRLPAPWAGVAVVAVLVASLVGGVGALDRGPKEDVRPAVAAVAAGHQPGQPVVAAARWDALGLDHYAQRNHPELVADLVLPPDPLPGGATIWVVRRSRGGVKGDRDKLAGLDAELAVRGLRLVEEQAFPGRYADTLVQRWEHG